MTGLPFVLDLGSPSSSTRAVNWAPRFNLTNPILSYPIYVTIQRRALFFAALFTFFKTFIIDRGSRSGTSVPTFLDAGVFAKTPFEFMPHAVTFAKTPSIALCCAALFLGIITIRVTFPLYRTLLCSAFPWHYNHKGHFP